jgi:hypothetical protein
MGGSGTIADRIYYSPQYRVNPPDRIVLNVINNLQNTGTNCSQVMTLANNYFYGSGSAPGQIQRLKLIMEKSSEYKVSYENELHLESALSSV